MGGAAQKRLSQSDLDLAYAIRVAHDGASFSSVESRGSISFFKRTIKKLQPELLPPNRKKVKTDVVRLWENNVRPKVRFLSGSISLFSFFGFSHFFFFFAAQGAY